MKFSGVIGFWTDEVEVAPGVWRGSILERKYVGNIKQNTRRFLTTGEQQNDNFKVNNRISILSDLYLQQNWPSIRYVIWSGAKLQVTAITVNYPRVELEIGGIYNGEDAINTPQPIAQNSK